MIYLFIITVGELCVVSLCFAKRRFGRRTFFFGKKIRRAYVTRAVFGKLRIYYRRFKLVG